MKIALFGPTTPWRGGIAHFNTYLYKQLAQKHELKLFSYCFQYPSFIYPGENTQEKETIFKIESVNYDLHSLKPWTWIGTAKKMAAFEPAICIFPWWSIFWFPHYRLMLPFIKHLYPRTKIILYCHNVVDHETASWKVKLTLNIFRQADGFICHSQQNKHFLEKIFSGAKIYCTPHPAYDKFGTTKISKNDAKKTLNIPENSQVMLFFGYVRKYKGLDLLISLLPTLIKRIPELHLLIAGEFWENRDNYESLIKPEIRNHVSVYDKYISNSEIPLFFRATDLCVLPYRDATGSGVAQLSLAQGVPIIGTKTGSLTEIIEDEINGYAVEPNNPKVLGEAIEKFFSHHNPQQFINGARTTSKKYSWDRAEETIMNLYAAL